MRENPWDDPEKRQNIVTGRRRAMRLAQSERLELLTSDYMTQIKQDFPRRAKLIALSQDYLNQRRRSD